MEVPEPGTESEMQLQPTPQLWQCQILNPLYRTGDQTLASAATLATAVGFLTHRTMAGTPPSYTFENHHTKKKKKKERKSSYISTWYVLSQV